MCCGTTSPRLAQHRLRSRWLPRWPTRGKMPYDRLRERYSLCWSPGSDMSNDRLRSRNTFSRSSCRHSPHHRVRGGQPFRWTSSRGLPYNRPRAKDPLGRSPIYCLPRHRLWGIISGWSGSALFGVCFLIYHLRFRCWWWSGCRSSPHAKNWSVEFDILSRRHDRLK